MEHRFACDCHNHSNCSFDGRSSMDDMCRQAEKLHLYYYTVSDHCECNKYEKADGHETGYREVARKAWAQMEQCKERYPKLRFLKGIELGQPLQNLSAAQEVLSGREYDFVIGSLHNVAGEPDFYSLKQEKGVKDRLREYFLRYFQELLEMVDWGRFDSLAHITYPLRYLCAPGEKPSFAPYREELEAVFSAMIRKDIALEMNTSRLLREDAPELPDLEVFSLYREMGGRLVTLGSDAHCVDDLGHGIDCGMEILREAGFTEFAVFQNREPKLLPLE